VVPIDGIKRRGLGVDDWLEGPVFLRVFEVLLDLG
jgi:hypothetical protein